MMADKSSNREKRPRSQAARGLCQMKEIGSDIDELAGFSAMPVTPAQRVSGCVRYTMPSRIR